MDAKLNECRCELKSATSSGKAFLHAKDKCIDELKTQTEITHRQKLEIKNFEAEKQSLKKSYEMQIEMLRKLVLMEVWDCKVKW